MTSDTDLDELYRIAANERRRTIIAILLREKEPLSIETLVRQIVENQKGITQHKAAFIETELRHRYLPMFSDANLIEFDSEREVVRPKDELSRFEQILPDAYLTTLEA